jgi:hypothetical protein
VAVPSGVGQGGVDLQGGRHDLHRVHGPLMGLPGDRRVLGRQRGGSGAHSSTVHHIGSASGFCDVVRDAGWRRSGGKPVVAALGMFGWATARDTKGAQAAAAEAIPDLTGQTVTGWVASLTDARWRAAGRRHGARPRQVRCGEGVDVGGGDLAAVAAAAPGRQAGLVADRIHSVTS